MKKLIIILLLVSLCFFTTACGKTKWEMDFDREQAYVGETETEVFEKATNENYELVAYLAKQILAGTNYMYLCRDDSSYKIIVIYHNTKKEVEMVSEKDFDFTKLTNQKATKSIVGGWIIQIPSIKTNLDKDVESSFNKAIKKVEDIKYYPGAIIGKSKDKVAIIAYGVTNPPDPITGVYVLTLNTKKNEIESSNYVDLSDYYEDQK